MIETKQITTLQDFQSLKKGDTVAVSWKRDMFLGNKEVRFGTYTIVENKERTTEIILQTKHNVYFNYMMFLNPKEMGVSNCKSIVLIKPITEMDNPIIEDEPHGKGIMADYENVEGLSYYTNPRNYE